MQRYDVVVVGAGPGGSVAAREAAEKSDKDVVVLEEGVRREDRETLGPDSTDAAGQLNYWQRMVDPESRNAFVDNQVNEIQYAEFNSPGGFKAEIGKNQDISRVEHLILPFWPVRDQNYDDIELESFGATYDRAALDDTLLNAAKEEGAEVRMGSRVQDVNTELGNGDIRHEVSVYNKEERRSEELEAEYLILADGPGRSVTLDAVAQFLDADEEEKIKPETNNHLAAQRNYLVPDEVYNEFEDKFLLDWWMPGHSTYLWIFPLENNVLEVGFTMPQSLVNQNLNKFHDAHRYPVIQPEDEFYPSQDEILNRYEEIRFEDTSVLELADEKGKNSGKESYVISSMPPIESPVDANIAVVGGAGGFTSAFHEGGYHNAVETGRIAGLNVAEDSIEEYNDEWKETIGHEVFGNLAFAETIRGYNAEDLDMAFKSFVGQNRPESLSEFLKLGKTAFSYCINRFNSEPSVKQENYNFE